DGVEGLLHISELSWDHVERTEDVLKVGEEVEVMVLSADKVRRRISLSLRQLHGGGPTGEGDEVTPPSYDYPEDEDDDSDAGESPSPMATALTDAGVEGTAAATADGPAPAAPEPESELEAEVEEAAGGADAAAGVDVEASAAEPGEAADPEADEPEA